MKANELELNCDGICKQRKPINELMLLDISTKQKRVYLYICKDCLKTAKPLTIKDIDYY